MMSEAALEEASVLSSIYCGEGEFVLVQQSGQDGIIVQINCTGGGEGGRDQECVALTEGCRRDGEAVKPREKEDEWTAVLLLDHMRSRNRYIGLLERWSEQLQLSGTLLLGENILVILQGTRPSVKEFCHRLKTVKVDVDSSGKKCKERMMKVLIETPSSSSGRHNLQGFIVKNYESVTELTAAFKDLHLTDLYQHIFPSLKD